MKRGFTLIELLVVIAIIGILVSVVLSSIAANQEKKTLPKAKSTIVPSNTYITPIARDPAVEADDRRINSCIESIALEQDRIQERFQKDMSDLDDKRSRQCFNNYSR